ncbi:MAG: DUF4249 family protein [Rhodothermales bacterium]|nr:DUF4249 family protein [Rhodothermales bacterium]MBO6778181.1 DUF4249 family protein [Rhodothermales bacterium]
MRATLLVLAALSLLGCKKTIGITEQPYRPTMAIEGLLMPGETPRIYLNETVPFFSSRLTPSQLFVDDAVVNILGPDGLDQLVVDSTYSRWWCRWEPFYAGSIQIRENATYTLSLTRRGQSYTAEATTNVPAATISDVSYVETFVDIYGGHEGVVVNFDDIPGRSDQYRFEMVRELDTRHETVDDREYRSPCLAEDEKVWQTDVGRFVYFDDRLDGAPVRFVVEPAHTNYKDDKALVYIQSLDREAAEFYERLDRQREANVNPFIEPVFLETGVHGLIGVFSAMNRSEPMPFVFPLDSG